MQTYKKQRRISAALLQCLLLDGFSGQLLFQGMDLSGFDTIGKLLPLSKASMASILQSFEEKADIKT